MTPAELKATRHQLGLSVEALGRALGYTGNSNTVSVQIRRYETGARDVPPWIARLVFMFGRFGVPEDLPS